MPPVEQPNESNTGPTTPKEELREISGKRITENGTVLENFRMTGQITVDASDVIIRNFYIDGQSWYGINVLPSSKNVVIEDGEITSTNSAGVNGSNYTARRLHIHHVGKDALKIGANVVIESCYIHHVGNKKTHPKVHADGIQSVGGDNVLIRWNNIDMPLQTDGYLNHMCIIIQAQRATLDDIRIQENWLNGGVYAIQLRSKKGGVGGMPTNSYVLDNLFGDDTTRPWNTHGDVFVHGNRRLSNLQLLPKQARGQRPKELLQVDTD